jgi:hypothetical protein
VQHRKMRYGVLNKYFTAPVCCPLLYIAAFTYLAHWRALNKYAP